MRKFKQRENETPRIYKYIAFVLIIAFYIYPMLVRGQGKPWPFDQLIAICIVNYIYKFIVAVILTPVIYIVHNRIEKYLGHDTAKKMKLEAMGIDNIVPSEGVVFIYRTRKFST